MEKQEKIKVLKYVMKMKLYGWCKKAMAELFDVGRPAITKHLNNIFKENELEKMQYVPFGNILQKMEKNIKHSSII